jgi:hypothetical protein
MDSPHTPPKTVSRLDLEHASQSIKKYLARDHSKTGTKMDYGAYSYVGDKREALNLLRTSLNCIESALDPEFSPLAKVDETDHDIDESEISKDEHDISLDLSLALNRLLLHDMMEQGCTVSKLASLKKKLRSMVNSEENTPASDDLDADVKEVVEAQLFMLCSGIP